MFTAGYKFGPKHPDIHFVKVGHSNPGEDYAKNFSRELDQAVRYTTAQDAERAAFEMTEAFRLDREEYHWCALVADDNGEEVTLWEVA